MNVSGNSDEGSKLNAPRGRSARDNMRFTTLESGFVQWNGRTKSESCTLEGEKNTVPYVIFDYFFVSTLGKRNAARITVFNTQTRRHSKFWRPLVRKCWQSKTPFACVSRTTFSQCSEPL